MRPLTPPHPPVHWDSNSDHAKTFRMMQRPLFAWRIACRSPPAKDRSFDLWASISNSPPATCGSTKMPSTNRTPSSPTVPQAADLRSPRAIHRNPASGRLPWRGVRGGPWLQPTGRGDTGLASGAALHIGGQTPDAVLGHFRRGSDCAAAGRHRTEGPEGPPRPRPLERPHGRRSVLGLSGQHAARVPLGHRLEHRQLPTLRAGLDQAGLRAFHAAIAAQTSTNSGSSTSSSTARADRSDGRPAAARRSLLEQIGRPPARGQRQALRAYSPTAPS